jgi:hypothetical protein
MSTRMRGPRRLPSWSSTCRREPAWGRGRLARVVKYSGAGWPVWAANGRRAERAQHSGWGSPLLHPALVHIIICTCNKMLTIASRLPCGSPCGGRSLRDARNLHAAVALVSSQKRLLRASPAIKSPFRRAAPTVGKRFVSVSFKGDAADGEVYQGVYGAWRITEKDRIEVRMIYSGKRLPVEDRQTHCRGVFRGGGDGAVMPRPAISLFCCLASCRCGATG